MPFRVGATHEFKNNEENLMKNDEKAQAATATANETSTALTEVNNDLEQVRAAIAPLSARNRDEMAMLAELDALDQQLENLEYETTAPSVLAASGVVFDILDAYPADIVDNGEIKTVCCFKVEECATGIIHIVMQSMNSIREVYAKRFGGYKALGAPQEVRTLRGYQFVESDNPKHRKAGNSAILLRKVKTGEFAS